MIPSQSRSICLKFYKSYIPNYNENGDNNNDYGDSNNDYGDDNGDSNNDNGDNNNDDDVDVDVDVNVDVNVDVDVVDNDEVDEVGDVVDIVVDAAVVCVGIGFEKMVFGILMEESKLHLFPIQRRTKITCATQYWKNDLCSLHSADKRVFGRIQRDDANVRTDKNTHNSHGVCRAWPRAKRR